MNWTLYNTTFCFQNPVNLTCIATAIPNATITWWVRDREINREIIDRNMQVNLQSLLLCMYLSLPYYLLLINDLMVAIMLLV
jgi:hypothetical protein